MGVPSDALLVEQKSAEFIDLQRLEANRDREHKRKRKRKY